MEATQVSLGGWRDKQNMGCKYNAILLSLKKEGYSDTCYNVDKPWRHTKWNKPLTKGQILYDFMYMMRYLE